MSIDLEDWFCVYNFSEAIPRDQWGQCELRVGDSTRRILELLAKHDVKATFFVLGWIAERVPDLVVEVEAAGHEIGTHGYSHQLLTHIDEDAFDADIKKSLDVLRGLVKTDILGFRAPSFSVTKKTMWAIDVLQRNGLRYDSSIFPVGFHPDYGIGDAPLEIYEHSQGVVEFPLSVAECFGKRIPCAGGGYFRLLPYALTRSLLKRCNAAGRPFVFYLHPWEVDPGQPRVALPWKKRFRHYVNLSRTYRRLDCLLRDFELTTMREVLGV